MAYLAFPMQPASGDSALAIPASTVRQLIAALGGSGQGLIAPPSPRVTHRAAGANWSVDLQPFFGIVLGDDVAGQGSYLVVNTAVANFTDAAFAAPGSGSRTHRLVAQVRDKRSNGAWGSTYDWAPVVVADTGGGEQNEPVSALTLGHIHIAAGQSNIADANIDQGYSVLRSLAPLGPWNSDQVNPAAWDVAGTWTDFASGNWPPLAFTVPPSGKVWVTIYGSPTSGGTSNNSYIGWRISGTDTVGNANNHAVAAGAGGAVRAISRKLVTGLTPGATDTVTPTWLRTATSAADGGDGYLTVEAVQ
jgi:hypothetical protein